MYMYVCLLTCMSYIHLGLGCLCAFMIQLSSDHWPHREHFFLFPCTHRYLLRSRHLWQYWRRRFYQWRISSLSSSPGCQRVRLLSPLSLLLHLMMMHDRNSSPVLMWVLLVHVHVCTCICVHSYYTRTQSITYGHALYFSSLFLISFSIIILQCLIHPHADCSFTIYMNTYMYTHLQCTYVYTGVRTVLHAYLLSLGSTFWC